MKEVRILSPQGILGYGFPAASFEAAIARKPHAIAVDAGSTDGGPHKLGAGVGIVSKAAVKRDLGMMIRAGLENHIPVIVGSAGGSGGHPHIQWTIDVVKELAKENGWNLKTAVIDATIDKSWLKQQLRAGEVKPMTGVPELTEDDVDQATEIVAQMGYEPYLEALNAGVDLIIGGRSYDPAMTVAACVHNGLNDIGLAYHMGKILECGALCAIPGSTKDCVLGIMHPDNFIIESMNSTRFCTPISVAAHTLYEKSHPYLLAGPGGVTDLEHCTFEPVSDHAVRVKGSRFIPSEKYMVKLEGAKRVGYRSIFIGGIRDPLAIAAVDEIVDYGRSMVCDFLGADKNKVFMDFKIYGKNGVMGDQEPVKEIRGHELCIVAEFVAPTQEMAAAACAYARSSMLHYHYTGRKATAGNLAFPFAPSDFDVGSTYQFNVYHLVPIGDPAKFFPTTYHTIA